MAQRRHELSDAEWALREPLMPGTVTRGRHYRDHRGMLDAMLFRLHTGLPWRDLPERYGPWRTVYSRWRRWSHSGSWDRLLQELRRQLDPSGSIDWTLCCVDGSNVRAHKAAAEAGKKLPLYEPADHGLGRSHGGWGTKLHLVTDGRGFPLAVKLSAGQANEALHATPLLDAVRICLPSNTVRQRPGRVAGDKGYSHRHIRQWLRRHHVTPVIPERRDQIACRRGCNPVFDSEHHRRRNVVERCIG